jgi:hypothetical protein
MGEHPVQIATNDEFDTAGINQPTAPPAPDDSLAVTDENSSAITTEMGESLSAGSMQFITTEVGAAITTEAGDPNDGGNLHLATTETGAFMTTENGDPIDAGNRNFVTTETGCVITTEDDDPIICDPSYRAGSAPDGMG